MQRYYELAEQFLRDLVAFPSVNGNELPAAQYIARVLRSYGFAAQLQQVGENRANVCATLGSGDRTLVFTGHLDVVPPGEGWQQRDPFTVEKNRDRFYGRGCCDMKGGIACMMAAAICGAERGIVKGWRLQLVFTADEELDGLGTRLFVSQVPPSGNTLVVIGEPTQLEVCIAHRGVSRFRVALLGKQCHSGTPGEGVNALYGAARFLLAVEELDKALQARDCGILPPPNITATVAWGGVKDNAVPGKAEVLLDCRTVPGEDPRPSIAGTLAKLFDATPITYSLTGILTVDPSATPADSPAVDLVCKAYRAAFRTEPKVTYFKGCCDMPYFCKAGYTQTLLCGPGAMEQAHTADEYISQSQLRQAVDLYVQMLLQA